MVEKRRPGKKAVLVHSPRFLSYRLGPSHPLRPERLQLTFDLIQACGLLDGKSAGWREPEEATREQLLWAHDPEYVEAVKFLSDGGYLRDPGRFGLETMDNPIFPGMYEASALCAGGSLLAAELVASGQAEAAFNIGGGLHHAHRDRAAGFCVFNDPVVAIEHLRRQRGEEARIAYLDLDAHHGDGVQEAYYHSRQVLTISVHESTRFLFPWRDAEPEDLGEGEGAGFSVNIPLSPYTDDDIFLWAFGEVVGPLLEAFRPEFVVAQLGCDGHVSDPQAHLALTSRGLGEALAELRRRPARLVALGGGGYNLEVVPRMWTLAFAQMAGLEAPEEIPTSQASRYPETGGLLRDPGPAALAPGEAEVVRGFAARSVERVKRLVFPRHGL